MAILALKNRQRTIPIKTSRLKRILLRALKGKPFEDLLPACPISSKPKPLLEISIVLVSDRQMLSMNKQYRGLEKTTDVLSFPMYDLNKGRNSLCTMPMPVLLGDIVISAPQASRQAIERGIEVEEEILRLIIHGFLHLLGYDHERDRKEAARMKRLEDRLVASLQLD